MYVCTCRDTYQHDLVTVTSFHCQVSQVELGKAYKNNCTIVPASTSTPSATSALLTSTSSPFPVRVPVSILAASSEKQSKVTPSRERLPARSNSLFSSPVVRSKRAKETSKVADRSITSRGIRQTYLREDVIAVIEEIKVVMSDVSDASSESSDFFNRVYNVRKTTLMSSTTFFFFIHESA